ncbi:hypothetical protein B296_00048528, partial [Ensete ventricosum]
VFVLFSLIVSTAFEVLALALLKVPQKDNLSDFKVILLFSKFITCIKSKYQRKCTCALCWPSDLYSTVLIGRQKSSFDIGNGKWFVFLILMQRNHPSVGHIPMPEPPESSIAMLVSMGFNSSAARQALVQARNDINVATNILLEAQTQ